MQILFHISGINVQDLRFTCTQQFSTFKQCSEQCYHREKYGQGCVGFVSLVGNDECKLCNPATGSEISSVLYTQMNNDDTVYIIKGYKKPDVYLPLEPENIIGTAIVGDGVTGT